MENQKTITLPEVIFFPAQAVKGNNLGGGFIKAGGLQIRFAVFINEKFSQGFSISLPFRKNSSTQEIVKEVEFVNKESEQYVYGVIAGKVSHLLGKMPTKSNQPYQAPPATTFQEGFSPERAQSARVEPTVITSEPKTIKKAVPW